MKPIFKLSVNGSLMDTLVDSGAGANFVEESFARHIGGQEENLPQPMKLMVADGSCHQLTKRLQLQVEDRKVEALIAPLGTRAKLILGFPWMRENQVSFDYEKRTMEIADGGGGKRRIPASLRDHEQKLEIANIGGESSESKLLITKRRVRKDLKNHKIAQVWAVQMIPTVSDEEEAPQFEEPKMKEIQDLLRRYPDVFPKEAKLTKAPQLRMDLTMPAMKIDTGDAEPVKTVYTRMGPGDQDELKKQLKQLLDAKLIRPSVSPWGSPVLFVTKKDGRKRMCVDYRGLNRVTRTDAYPLPRIRESLDRLGKARVFSSLDATWGFWQNPVATEDIHKTAFNTRYGSYEFMVTPFGLKNSPSAYQRMMDEVFKNQLDKSVIVYVDDILVYSLDLETHITHLKEVAALLDRNGLQINLRKSKFALSEVLYCGYIVGDGCIRMDPNKIAVMRSWPVPQNPTDVRSFLGFTGFYRQFIAAYGDMAAPLTSLTGKGEWVWTSKEDEAFKAMKEAMTKEPVLQYPDESLTFHVWPDASPWAVGGVLTQDQGSGHRPIAYEYHKLGPAEMNYPHHEKEVLAMLFCLRKWRCYFEGRKLTVHSDSSTVVNLATVRDPHRRLVRWLQEYQYWSPDIVHVPGKQNPADGPSRLRMEEDWRREFAETDTSNVMELDAIGIPIEIPGNPATGLAKEWCEHVAFYLEKARWPQGLSEVLLAKCKREEPKFEVRGRLFCRKREGRGSVPYLPYGDRRQTMARYHVGLGHLGTRSLLAIVQERFWWPDMERTIAAFLKTCPQCQLDKSASKTHSAAPLKPMPSMALPFERWGMDFVQNLPETKAGNRHIITAIDYATRWVVCKAVKRMDSEAVADFLYHDILMHYGTPYEVITDRGSALLSDSMKRFEETQKIRHAASTPYHPQTNGMVERMHAMLGACITRLSDGRPDRWDEFLPQTLFSLRVRTHAVTKFSPFYLLYGVHPRIPGDTLPLQSSMQPLDELEKMEERAEFTARMLDELGQDRAAAYHRSKAQEERMKQRYDKDKNVTPSAYGLQDWVKLKHQGKTKFEFEWKGPYFIRGFGIVPETYYIKEPNGRALPTAVAQDQLAPWLAPLGPDEDYFYDGTKRSRQ
jgi:transposase InsO family protein